jgi:riboflavin biosynthesis pyrimidine reductase
MCHLTAARHRYRSTPAEALSTLARPPVATVPAMRQLYPMPEDAVDPAERYASDHRPAPDPRPWLLVNMIASLDGATAVDGLSGGLGGPADKIVFSAIRSVPDIIMVAAGTLRAEHYGPPRLPPDRRGERTARGQAAEPRLAIVTAHLDLDLDSPVFTDTAEAPVVITAEPADASSRAALDKIAAVADVVVTGTDRVDLRAGLERLRTEFAATTVLAEGGPSLNGALVSADVVDELCLTHSPMLVGGESPRLAHGPVAHPTRLVLRRVLEQDGLLFTRHTRD